MWGSFSLSSRRVSMATPKNLPKAYEEIIDFIAGTDPGKVVAFQPSKAVKDRVSDLIRREKEEGLLMVKRLS
jgi:hypothetical protein